VNGQIVNDKISTPHDQFEDIRKSALPDNSVKIHSTNLSVLGIALNALAALMLAMNTRAALVNLDILKNCYDQRNDKERNCGGKVHVGWCEFLWRDSEGNLYFRTGRVQIRLQGN
jgi:hypothetical protein